MTTEERDKKKLLAAIAGVSAYIQAEQEAAAAGPPVEVQAPAAPVRLWALSGRQTQMMNRQLMQMRTFNK